MAQRDAFGNLLDEDPIKAMGWEAPRGATTTPTAARIGDQVHRADAASLSAGLGDKASDLGRQVQASLSTGDLGAAVRSRRSRRSAASAFGTGRRIPFLGGLVRLAIFAAIAAWILPVGQLVDAARDATSGTAERADPARVDPGSSGGGLPLAPGQEPSRAGAPSPLTTAGFTEALAATRKAAGAGSRPVLVRVDGTALIAQVRTRDGGQRLLRAQDGEATVLNDGPRDPGARTYAWGDVDRRAPARLVRRLGELQYAVLLRSPSLQWTALAGDRTYTAGPDGRDAEGP